MTTKLLYNFCQKIKKNEKNLQEKKNKKIKKHAPLYVHHQLKIHNNLLQTKQNNDE